MDDSSDEESDEAYTICFGDAFSLFVKLPVCISDTQAMNVCLCHTYGREFIILEKIKVGKVAVSHYIEISEHVIQPFGLLRGKLVSGANVRMQRR